MLVDVWHEQKHAWPLQEAWLTERGEKREKVDSKVPRNFFSFPSLFLSLFSCVSLMSIFFFTYDLKRSYFTRILVYFCQGQVACSDRLYFQLLWDAYSETCDASSSFSEGVSCSSVPLQNCTCPHGQAGATVCQPSMAASSRMKRPTHCRQWDVHVLVSVHHER